MRSKPVVDRLERELAPRARVLRVDILSGTGTVVARAHDVDLVPTVLVIDGKGREAARFRGVDTDSITRAVQQLSGS